MTQSKFGLALVCVAVVAVASQASAQTTKPKPAAAAPAAAAPAPLPQGPTVAGLCVFDRRGVIMASTVGKFVNTRLGLLQGQAEGELSAEQKQIQADATALEATKSTTPPDQFEQKGAAINQRVGILRQKAQLRQREFEATEQKAVGRVLQESQPYLRQAYIDHHCSILLNAESILVAAPAYDLTGSVTQGLDGHIQSFQFDREHLDPQTGQPVAQ